MNPKRIEALDGRLKQFGFDGAILIPGSTLYYLTGYSFHLMERPVFLLVVRGQTPVIVLPDLERPRVTASPSSLELFSYAEDDASRSAALQKAIDRVGSTALDMAIEPLIMRYFELDLLRSAAPDWTFRSGDELFSALRARKDPAEIEYIQRAVDIAETALQKTIPLIKVGMTEDELAAELVVQLLRAGSEPDLPFQPIVASGPNSALPHATPTNRRLAKGDLLILDWGARSGGYVSDITRTFALGEIDPEYSRIHQIVLEANIAGRSAAQPGVTCHAVDLAARQIILESGYGEYFIHRTGHGIGLEAHEPPNVRAENMDPLEAGMTFTIEPGIYLPGRAGVRIEDNLHVTDGGARTMTSLTRTLDLVG